ncbi:MAG TPA: hypothetical protein VFO00_04480 [Vitreimonas sp.]|nr:hypothetical protein [Vitreimonas sp.]
MTFHKFAVGSVLAVAMVGVLGTSALVFSSRDFQFGVAQVAPTTNGRVDFAELDRVEAEIATIRDASQGTREDLAEVQEHLAALDRSEAAVNQSRAEIVGDVARIEQSANVEASASAGMTTQGLSQRINTLAGQSSLSAPDQQRVATLASDVRDLAAQEAAVASTSAERAALNEQQRLVGDQVAQSDSQIRTLQARVVPETDHYDRIRNEARSLQSLSVFGASAYLAQGHPSLLSTVLVLLMGALGSLLYLFPAYLNRPEPVTMAEIFVRLVFGMCAALSLYVLANAAIAGFSIGSGVAQATTSSLLNPFTVSLVGIVAGVLSEDIAKWIQERGRGVFTQGGVASARPAAAPQENAPTGGLVNNEAIR